jgi:hypothetical protein
VIQVWPTCTFLTVRHETYHHGRHGFSSTLGTSGAVSFFTTRANGFCNGGLYGLRGTCWPPVL